MAIESQGHGHVAREGVASDYDTFVNWDARLARELPFFRARFAEVDGGVHRVVDVGAGSAKLAIAFALEGMSVDAVDPDDSMLLAAEKNIAQSGEAIAAAGGAVRLARGGFGDLAGLGLEKADALICTGNALAHAEGIAGLRAALADFSAVMRVGGVLVLHLLNHDRLLAGHVRALSPMVRDTPAGLRVYLRVIENAPDDASFHMNFLTLEKSGHAEDGTWELSAHGGTHTVITAETLTRELGSAGFGRIELFGGHDGHALTPSDESVIAVARKA